MKRFYIQVDANGYITDCIEFPHGDYIQVDLELPLPESFIAGIYKYLESGDFELDEEKRVKMLSEAQLEGAASF